MTDDAWSVVELLDQSARSHPDHPAVRDDERALSYAELASRADALASVLSGLGVARRDRVAIYLPHGVDVFVAMLAILKAGAAYVAVDDRYPDSRRDQMIVHSGAKVVLTRPGWAGRIRPLGGEVLEYRSAAPDPADPALAVGVAPPRPALTGDDLACVLFTSGSSGVPKAIMLDHRNLVHLARNKVLAPVGPGDRVGQVASLSFDTFHVESWCSLAQGAEVVVLPTMPDLIANDLSRELRRRRISVLVAPTMAVNHVVHEDRDAFSSLRILYTGGDVLQPAAARTLLSGSFRGEFYNLYGPTEATTCCTSHLITAVADDCGSIPIGLELDGATVHILDTSHRRIPTGDIGELHIGGHGVGPGYLGQPAMTAERFRPDPFGPSGSRMYATGDRAWRHPDGVVEFAGRVDEQVKIRGYRVEPREAEQVIAKHPAVRDAVVVVAGEEHDKRLIALVVLYERLSPKQLRAFATEALPDYLVPSTFIPVAEIPGNHHGKRDAAKLRQFAQAQLRREGNRFEPRDDVDAYLVELWEQLLSVEWIGAQEDFFALGGNSMLAFRAQARIKRDLGVELEVREILHTTELANLAGLVRSRRGVAADELSVGRVTA
jgi:amino acid adenylation domain-containing protein